MEIIRKLKFGFFGKNIGKNPHCGMRERGQWVGELLYFSI